MGHLPIEAVEEFSFGSERVDAWNCCILMILQTERMKAFLVVALLVLLVVVNVLDFTHQVVGPLGISLVSNPPLQFKLRPRTDPDCVHSYIDKKLTFILCSAFVDTRPRMYGLPAEITVNGYFRKHFDLPKLSCAIRHSSGDVSHVEAVAFPFEEIGYWVGVAVKCGNSTDLYSADFVSVGINAVGSVPVGINAVGSAPVGMNAVGSNTHWIRLNSVPDGKTIELDRGMTKMSSSVPERVQGHVPIAVCVKPYVSSGEEFDYGLVEWIEYHILMGVSRIVVYERHASPLSTRILLHYQNLYPGLIDIIPWRLPDCQSTRKAEGSSDNYCKTSNSYIGFNGQLASNQDCTMRLAGWAQWIVSVDFDELIVPSEFQTFPDLISSQLDKVPNAFPSQVSALHFTNYFYHDCSWNATSVTLDRHKYLPSKYWFLNGRTRDRGNAGILRRSKMIYNPLIVDRMLVHHPGSLFPSRMDPSVREYNRWYLGDRLKVHKKAEGMLGDRVIYVKTGDARLMHMRREKSDEKVQCDLSKNWVEDTRFYDLYGNELLQRVELAWALLN